MPRPAPSNLGPRPLPGPLHRRPLIAGPTAGGKSALAVATALLLQEQHDVQAEIVSADSMQVFRRMDIGTGKITDDERRAIPHHLIDVAEPTEAFSVERWLRLADAAIEDIESRGNVPIVVGGTHLYIKAFLEGLFEGPPKDEALRARLEAMDPTERRRELERVDPQAAARIHPNDVRRTVRALEVFRATGTPISEQQSQWDAAEGTGRAGWVLVGLVWESEALNRRINARVRAMIEQGFVEEVRALLEAGQLGEQAREGLGFKQLAAALASPRETPDDDARVAEAIEKTKIETRRFAKNQRTWLRRLRTTPGSVWLEMGETDPDQAAQAVVDAVLTPPETLGPQEA